LAEVGQAWNHGTVGAAARDAYQRWNDYSQRRFAKRMSRQAWLIYGLRRKAKAHRRETRIALTRGQMNLKCIAAKIDVSDSIERGGMT